VDDERAHRAYRGSVPNPRQPDRANPPTRPTLSVVPLAVVVAAVSLLGTLGSATHTAAARPLDAAGIVLVLIGPLALIGRYRFPVYVLGVATVALVAYVGVDYPLGPVFLSGVVAVFTAVTSGRRWAALAIIAVAAAALLGLRALSHPERGLPLIGLTVGVAWLVAVVAVAEGVRLRRERNDQTRATQEAVAGREGSEERVRIARDLHDVLGHHISLINVQAGVALHLMDADPEQARGALMTIKQSSRDLLREMRATLGVLRAVDAPALYHPVPGLERLDELLSEVGEAGLPVATEIVGRARVLPAGTDAAAYRIVQEALTNTRRHVAGAAATVGLRYDHDTLTIEVNDHGGRPLAATAGSGSGLVGMHERAAALGGTVEAGPTPDGGWRVQARLPAAPHPGPPEPEPPHTDPPPTALSRAVADEPHRFAP